MSRYVAVRYLVPVYCTVDIDAEPIGVGDELTYPDDAVAEVKQGDSDITRLDDADAIAAMIAGPVLDTAYTGEDADMDALTDAERAKAIDVAERTIWPVWEGY